MRRSEMSPPKRPENAFSCGKDSKSFGSDFAANCGVAEILWSLQKLRGSRKLNVAAYASRKFIQFHQGQAVIESL